jgi:hypothetical protein
MSGGSGLRAEVRLQRPLNHPRRTSQTCCDLAHTETFLAQSSDGLDIQDDRRPAKRFPFSARTV